MKQQLCALILSALALPVSGLASELSYSYLEGGYLATRVDYGDSGHGWKIGGSVELGRGVYMFGSYSKQEQDGYMLLSGLDGRAIDVMQFNADPAISTLGFGYHHSIGARTDLVAQLAYWHVDFAYLGNIDGGELEVGVRSRLNDRFEGWAMLGYRNTEVRENGSLRIGTQYRFNDRWGLVADIKQTRDDKHYFVGPRLSF